MQKIINYIYNNKIKLLTIISIISLILIFTLTKKKETIISTPTPNNLASFKDLTPGISTKEEVLNKLGTALNAKVETDKITYEYKSSNRNFNSIVVVVNDKLSYLKLIYTISDNITSEKLTNEYGKPEKILYGSDYSVGYKLNVYPSKGIAFSSHQKSGNVKEVWYFIPTDLENFIKLYTPGYSEEINIVQ